MYILAVLGAGILRALARLFQREPESVVVATAQDAAQAMVGIDEALMEALLRERARTAELEARLAELQRRLRDTPSAD